MTKGELMERLTRLPSDCQIKLNVTIETLDEQKEVTTY